ncbi:MULTISPECIES: alpha/beta fold hydrolase [Nitrosomonas]|uniref:Esterase/lipase/thioesterase family active site n=1 Tax=Nitrosomonas europaea (strain ATCC 19718 / CIP 103999 / KCTC 2705 / NBRC 14298) TaxID=228410 RepID=Q82X43_NITEU|nr:MULTISPECIES: alpha/beta hydrolase [Nitrosomonas]MCE7916971.1 alpha/beta hydrolase [Nitrosomonas sp. PRO5]CAD84367.1 Esterase/lipase/thioesterase family active site [Nitrosomonas europaea ATCC 19718]SJZ49382.1 Pimeloyl-ACP methyl ester carboxylesterase [Nitrosomonas europaea]HBF24669.1 alpha/beta hydrolase [Nitrosomonas sp.]
MKNSAAIAWKFLSVPAQPGKMKSGRGWRQLAYTDWGNPKNEHVVVCAHGLTRNCRDFDFLAAALEQDFRVICVDMAGRGRSDWLKEAEDYNSAATYVSDMEHVLEHVYRQNDSDSFRIYWVGVSMGGLIGMLLAARQRPAVSYRFRTLVMSDIGPHVSSGILSLFATTIGKDPRFRSLSELESHMRATALPYSPLTDTQWHHLALYSAREYEDGTIGYRYDPAISSGFRPDRIKDIDLWAYWNRLDLPVLVLRGEKSGVLTPETAGEMQLHRSNVQITELAGIGHAPMLMDADQINLVRDYLLKIRNRTE